MERKHACLPEIEEDTPDAIPHKARGRVKEVSSPQASQQARHERHFRTMSPKLPSRGTAPTRDAQTHAQVSRANRYRRYQAVLTLHQQGFSQREIARRLKIGRETVRRFLRAEHSDIAELKSFAQSIRRDYAAVKAAFFSPWSNGQLEAQVNRLKLTKRQTYGRAHFDLLRLRVLHAV